MKNYKKQNTKNRPETLTTEQYRALARKKNNSKYKAKKTVYNGRKYDSASEARYAAKLDALKQTGVINSYEAQKRFKLRLNDQETTTYVADFVIKHNDGTIDVVDVKGYRGGVPYQLFKLKKALMLDQYNLAVKEVTWQGSRKGFVYDNVN